MLSARTPVLARSPRRESAPVPGQPCPFLCHKKGSLSLGGQDVSLPLAALRGGDEGGPAWRRGGWLRSGAAVACLWVCWSPELLGFLGAFQVWGLLLA